jgi:hypothetical protein
METMRESYKGAVFDEVGPRLITDLWDKWNRSKPITNTPTTTATHLSTLPRFYFYPVHYRYHWMFTQHPTNNTRRFYEAMRAHSFGAHLWNKRTSNATLYEGSILHQLMECVCPSTFTSIFGPLRLPRDECQLPQWMEPAIESADVMWLSPSRSRQPKGAHTLVSMLM